MSFSKCHDNCATRQFYSRVIDKELNAEKQVPALADSKRGCGTCKHRQN